MNDTCLQTEFVFMSYEFLLLVIIWKNLLNYNNECMIWVREKTIIPPINPIGCDKRNLYSSQCCFSPSFPNFEFSENIGPQLLPYITY